MMERAAPGEPSGVRAAWLAARRHGRTFGAEQSPAPGDLVFWHDTYDRNRNGLADDRYTHVGIVEHVQEGTVTFLHRGGKGVARGVMTLGRRGDASARDGRRLNSPIRAIAHPVKTGGLAGELFAGYGRIGPEPIAEAPRQASPPPRPERQAEAPASRPAEKGSRGQAPEKSSPPPARTGVRAAAP
jgi:hypothetical protein